MPEDEQRAGERPTRYRARGRRLVTAAVKRADSGFARTKTADVWGLRGGLRSAVAGAEPGDHRIEHRPEGLGCDEPATTAG